MHADHEYLAAGYVLGGLTPEEDKLASSLYSSHPEFRAEVASFEATMASVAETDEPARPSAELEAAILSIPQRYPAQADPEAPARDSGESGTTAVEIKSADTKPEPAGTPRRGRISATMFALVASVLAVMVIAMGTLLFSEMRETRQMEDSLAATEEQRQQLEQLLSSPDLAAEHAESSLGGSVTVTFSQNSQMIHVVPHDLPSLTDDESMQMWLIGEEGPHSIGLMSTEGPQMLSGIELGEGVVFGVTVEPAGGSPQPTSDPIIAAEL